MNIGRVYLRNWRNRMQAEQEDWQKLVTNSAKLRKSKIRPVFKSWRSASLELKVQHVQWRTALHIHRQKVLAKSFGALSAFARYSARSNFLDNKAEKASLQKQLTKNHTNTRTSHCETYIDSLYDIIYSGEEGLRANHKHFKGQ